MPYIIDDPEYIKTDLFSIPASGGFRSAKTGVKVTHIPTMLSATCSTENTAYRNRLKALEELGTIINEYTDKQLIPHKSQVLKLHNNGTTEWYTNAVKVIAAAMSNPTYVVNELGTFNGREAWRIHIKGEPSQADVKVLLKVLNVNGWSDCTFSFNDSIVVLFKD